MTRQSSDPDQRYPRSVEAKDVRFTQLATTDDGATLLMAGFIFHSALAVRDVRIDEGASPIIVELLLAPVAPGRDGNFRVAIPLPEPTAPVVFGPARTQIWPRTS